VDPALDITFPGSGAIIDATKKGSGDVHTREWPDDLFMPQAVKDTVDEKIRLSGIADLLCLKK